MDKRLITGLKVFLVFIVVLSLPMPVYQYFLQLHIWPFSQMLIDIAFAAIVLTLLLLEKRDFSVYGVSLRNSHVDMKVAAILILPLCILNVLSEVDISSIFSVGGLFSLILLSATFWMILYVTMRPDVIRRFSRRALALLPALGMAALIIVPALFLPGIMKFTSNTLSYFILAFCFVGPVEELVFRGYVQSQLNEAFGRPWRFLGINWGMDLIVASLLFGLVHALSAGIFNPFFGKYGVDPLWGTIAFFMGLILGIVREKTGSIVAPSILHGALDFVSAVF